MPRSRSETPISHRSRSRSRSRSPLSDRESSEERPTEFRVHIAELSPGIAENDVRKAFQRFGSLVDVWVANASCFAFVVFKYKEDAQKAIDQMDGRVFGNSRIKVTWARPRTRNRSQRHDPNMRCYKCGHRGHFSRECGNQSSVERSSYRRDMEQSRYSSIPHMAFERYGRSRSPYPAFGAPPYLRHGMPMYSGMGRRYDPYIDGFYFPGDRGASYEHRSRDRAVRLTPPSVSLRYSRR